MILHATFRLCVNQADAKQLLQASKWPSDILISDWFFSNKNRTATDNMHTGSNLANKPTLLKNTAADYVADSDSRCLLIIRGNVM